MKAIGAMVVRRADFRVIVGLVGSLLAPVVAMSTPVTFDITDASFTYQTGSGYGVDGDEVPSANPTLLNVQFSTSGFVDQHFWLDNPSPSSRTFLFGTVDFMEPNAGGGISSNETDSLEVFANFLFTNPTGTSQVLTAVGTAITGGVSDAFVDYTLSWTPVLVDFQQGGQFQLDLADLVFTSTASKELNATITLLALPVQPTVLSPDPLSAVPEPGTLALLSLGLAGIGVSLRRAKHGA